MDKLVNHVPELLLGKNWNVKEFVARCMLAGLSSDTAYRLTRGETQFTTETLQVVASILDLTSISQIIDVAQQ